MRLFRAISYDEYSILKWGKFTPGPNSMEGKWFAETRQHAILWGQSMTFDPGFLIVEIEVSHKISEGFFRLTMLDGIGPARYAEIEQLQTAIIIKFENIL